MRWVDDAATSAERGKPVVFGGKTKHRVPEKEVAPPECTIPRLLDDAAARFPKVKIIMAHLSHP